MEAGRLAELSQDTWIQADDGSALLRELTREHAQRYEAELATRGRRAQRSSAKT